MLYLLVRTRQQENSLQTVCSGKIQHCIFAVMFSSDEDRERTVLFTMVFTANNILFLLASSSFLSPLYYVPCSVPPGKEVLWSHPASSTGVPSSPGWVHFLRSVVVLFSRMRQKPPIHPAKLIPAFTNLSVLYKEVRTVVDTFGNKQKNPSAQISRQDPTGYQGFLNALWTSKFPSTFCGSCCLLINSLREQLEFDQYKICEFSNCGSLQLL